MVVGGLVVYFDYIVKGLLLFLCLFWIGVVGVMMVIDVVMCESFELICIIGG